RPHEPDELVESARLKGVVRPFLFADRRRAALSVMMTWTHDQVVLHLAYLVEERIVHLFHARPRKIHTAAVAHEEAVPREGVPRDQIAAGVGRVAWCMNDLHFQLSDLDHHAVLEDEVLSNVAESMGRDLRPGLFGEGRVEPRARTTLAARRIRRGGYGGTVRNRGVFGVPCSGRSHATSTRVLPPYPLRRHRLLGTCGYRSSPSSRTAHRKSF